MEDALKKLDKLTQEEARMAVAQNLKATHSVDERVRGVTNTVVAIDNRVTTVALAIDDGVRGVREQVFAVDDRVASVDNKVAEVINGAQIIFTQAQEKFNPGRSDGKEANQVIKQTANDVDQVKRLSSPNFINADYRSLHIVSENQLRESIHKWLSPPDSSTNHNIACSTHHKKAATWFFQGTFFREWKSKGSLIWIHGKRACSRTSHSIPSDEVSNFSWLRQEYSLVS